MLQKAFIGPEIVIPEKILWMVVPMVDREVVLRFQFQG